MQFSRYQSSIHCNNSCVSVFLLFCSSIFLFVQAHILTTKW